MKRFFEDIKQEVIQRIPDSFVAQKLKSGNISNIDQLRQALYSAQNEKPEHRSILTYLFYESENVEE